MSGNEIFVERLKSLRKERGLTQKQLAADLGISLPAVINYENAQRFPSSAALTLLSQYFHVSKEYLSGESNERETRHTYYGLDRAEAVQEGVPTRLNKLNGILKGCSPEELKMSFDILLHLCYILELKDEPKKMTVLSMLNDVAAAAENLINEKGTDSP